ncbi:hypothetical protein BDQ17DRAFT_147961 [Cyathus striatus]|nr:hypothetical protein BDQ17DRAFT_147961 [Cyathus striatus]
MGQILEITLEWPFSFLFITGSYDILLLVQLAFPNATPLRTRLQSRSQSRLGFSDSTASPSWLWPGDRLVVAVATFHEGYLQVFVCFVQREHLLSRSSVDKLLEMLCARGGDSRGGRGGVAGLIWLEVERRLGSWERGRGDLVLKAGCRL